MSEGERNRKTTRSGLQTALRIGFTAILLGYFLVWLPHRAAGLSFIGLELGEWVKFLPQYRSGEIAANRSFFYLPPITLGLMLALWTASWPNRRWQTWAMRVFAVLVAMLAFPAIEAILYEGIDQWLGRLLLILLVAVVAVLMLPLGKIGTSRASVVAWSAIAVLALLGLALPTWAYLAFRTPVAQLFDQRIGIGPGLWLNAFGHLAVAVIALLQLAEWRARRVGHSG